MAYLAPNSLNGRTPTRLDHGFIPSESISRDVELVEENISDRVCWVCYCGDEDSLDTAQWSHPCKCRGGTKWVHQSCLQRWVDNKQHDSDSATVACKACGYEYVIVYPEPSLSFRLVERLCRSNTVLNRYIFGGLIVGGVYLSGVTYGTCVILQICGNTTGMQLLRGSDPLHLAVSLPSIPLLLLASKLINWRVYVHRFYRCVLLRIYPFSRLRPKHLLDWREREYFEDVKSEGGSLGETICSAIALPTMASLVGNTFLSWIEPGYKRSLIGGLVYVCSTGLLDIAYSELRFFRTCQRSIEDYKDI